MDVSERQFRRVEYEAHVMLEPASGREVAGRTVDVSEGGMRVRASRPLPKGARVRCQVEVEGKPYQVEGRVVWAVQTPGRVREGGIEFTDVTAGLWARVGATVAARGAADGEREQSELHVRRVGALAPIEAIPVELVTLHTERARGARPHRTWWAGALLLGVGVAALLAWAVAGSQHFGSAVESEGGAPGPSGAAANDRPATLANESETEAGGQASTEAGAQAPDDPAPSVTIESGHTVVTLPLSRVPEDLEHYTLADPDGIVIDIQGATPAFSSGRHEFARDGVPAIATRSRDGSGHIRVFWSSGVPDYELELRDHVLTLRIVR